MVEATWSHGDSPYQSSSSSRTATVECLCTSQYLMGAIMHRRSRRTLRCRTSRPFRRKSTRTTSSHHHNSTSSLHMRRSPIKLLHQSTRSRRDHLRLKRSSHRSVISSLVCNIKPRTSQLPHLLSQMDCPIILHQADGRCLPTLLLLVMTILLE